MKKTEEKIEKLKQEIEVLTKKLRTKKETLKALEKTLRQEILDEERKRADQILEEVTRSRGGLTEEVFDEVLSLLRSSLPQTDGGASEKTAETIEADHPQEHPASYY